MQQGAPAGRACSSSWPASHREANLLYFYLRFSIKGDLKTSSFKQMRFQQNSSSQHGYTKHENLKFSGVLKVIAIHLKLSLQIFT